MATAVKPANAGTGNPTDTTPIAPGENGTPAAPKKKRMVLPIVLGLLVIGLGWFGKTVWYNRSHESTDNAQVDGHIVPVIAKVGGYVTAVRVAENQPVREGELLAQIDDAEYRVRIQQADAELAAARATAGGGGASGQAAAQVRAATGQQGVAQAQIDAARAAAEKARADFSRMKELADKQIVSRQQLDAARAAAEAADAQLVAVQRQAGAAGATVENAEAGVRLAEARLAAAAAARSNAALQLSYTRLDAPVTGTVARKAVEVGQLVQPGQTLLSVVADTGIWVTANFKETQLKDLRVGQKAELEVDAYPGCTAHAEVASVSAATGAKFALLPPDNATGNFTKVVQRVPVRLRITEGCGNDRPLRPGMSVTAHVSTG